ncbi:MAG TPA: DUF4384 domain-containing protein [Longimicrobium sp.]|nr:DUF4384 domain-containing protein [Longimicrobium sp.]
MRNKILAGLALTALAAATPAAAETAPALMLNAEAPIAAAAKAAQRSGVRVWVDNYRDYYRSHDRFRVRVRPDFDGYLAVFHIDTNGDVDVLFPRNDYDEGWVEGGRTLTLGSRGRWDYLNVRGGYGVGYVLAVALDEPLELWRVRDLYSRRFGSWDNNYSVYGDPFYAMDELVRAIVPETAYGYEAVDYYTYHMGRRYDYPRYACYDGFGDWYYDTHYSYYGSRCDRVRVILINRPWYYDTYRWRGSRRVYYDRYYYRTATRRPLHGYKERTQSQAPPARSSTTQRRPSSSGGTASAPDTRAGGGIRSQRPERPAREGTVSARPESERPGREGTSSARPESRPTREGTTSSRRPEGTERAAPSSRPERGTYEPRVRDRGGESPGGGERRTRDRPSQPRSPETSSATPPQQDRPVEPQRDRPTFQRRPERSNDQPRRESPPQRSAEPRRESPPARSAEPRRESPPQRSAEPRRESPPPRSSSPPSSRSGGGSRTRPSDS